VRQVTGSQRSLYQKVTAAAGGGAGAVTTATIIEGFMLLVNPFMGKN
jgi:hypothetical protein